MSHALRSIITNGDSNTEGSTRCTISWPYYLRALVGGNFLVAQQATGGYTAAQMLTDWDAGVRTALVTTFWADHALHSIGLMGGTNNLADAAATTFATLRQMADDYVADNANTPGFWGGDFYWLTVPPCLHYLEVADAGTAAAKQAVLEELNDLIRAYDQPGVRIVDVYPELESSVTPGYMKEGESGDLDYATSDSSGSTDYLHLNNAGQAKIAELVYAAGGWSTGHILRNRQNAGRRRLASNLLGRA